jgi:hypothetical protein
MDRAGDNSENVAINSTSERIKTHVYLQNTIDNLFKLSLPVQQKLVSSICAEKLIIDEKECRTPEYNEVIQLICRLGEDSKEIKKEQASNSGSLSNQVNRIGISSNQLRHELKELFKVKYLIFNAMHSACNHQ